MSSWFILAVFYFSFHFFFLSIFSFFSFFFFEMSRKVQYTKGLTESSFLCVFGANAANLILQFGKSGPAGQDMTDNITLQACRAHHTPCGWFDVTLQLHSL